MTTPHPLLARANEYLSEWPADTLHAASMLSPAHVWDWFGDAGCFIGPGGPFAGKIEGYNAGAMTDPARTPFQRLLYKPATVNDPHAFIAVRPLPSKQCKGRLSDSMGYLGDIRANLRDREDGLILFNLHFTRVCRPGNKEEEERKDWPPEACLEATEKELRAAYGAALVTWV